MQVHKIAWYNSSMKKNLVTFSLFFVLVVGASLNNTKQAHAQAVVTDPLNTIQATLNQVTNASNLGLTTKMALKDLVLKPALKTLASSVLDKITNDVINWANGGFDDEPGFINNWGEFLKGTEYDVYYDSFTKALDEASRASGQNIEIEDLAKQAEENYFNQQNSNNAKTKRNIAKTIAQFASEKLNRNSVDDIINGRGETLSKILGSDEAKEEFTNDITVGGWDGYIALANPSNSDFGVQSLITSALNNKAQKEITNTIDEVQTPVKYLSKTACRNNAEDENGNCLEGEVIVTPGSLVESKLSNALQSEEDQLKFTDELVGILIKSLGKLTDNLIQNGISRIGQQIEESSFFNKEEQSVFENFQNLEEFESNNKEQENLPTWRGLQSFVDFQRDFEPTLNNIVSELGYITEQRKILTEAQEDIMLLDRCIPGPDYKWEERFVDLAFSIQETKETKYPDDENAELSLPDRRNIQSGLQETKIMVNDPLVNIPGSAIMKQTIERFLQGYENKTVVESRLNDTQIASSIALSLAGEIQAEFDVYSRKTFGITLPLFSSDWDKLSTANKTKLVGLIDDQYLLLGPGQTIDSLSNEEAERIKNAVLTFAWKEWENNTSQEKKDELGAIYLEIESNAPSDAQVQKSKALLETIKKEKVKIAQYRHDCYVFQNYVLDGPAGLSDAVVRAYLAGEYTKQTDGNNNTISAFETTVMTSPSAIANSILGFPTQNDFTNYMNNNYPPFKLKVGDGEKWTDIINNVKNLVTFNIPSRVSNLFDDNNIKDARKQNIADEYTSPLYCRTTAVFFARNVDDAARAKNFPQTYCYYPWSEALPIDYKSALYGLN